MAVFTVDPATDLLTSAGHTVADGKRICVQTNGTLPQIAGGPATLDPTVDYYARDVTLTTLRLALTSGGAAIDLTDAGAGVHVIRSSELTIVDAGCIAEDVADTFALANRTDRVVFGWVEPTKQNNQAATPARAGRVVIVPGDDTGKAGKYTGPVQIGGKRRHLANRQELFQVRIWGHDPARPIDEKAQYRATRSLEDATLNALADAALGRYELSDPKWTISPVERLFGKEIFYLVQLDVAVLRTPLAAFVTPSNTPDYTASMAFAAGDVVVCPHS